MQIFTDPEFLGLVVVYGLVFFIAWVSYKLTK
jgi:hypothetical protein